jgi:aldehyde dehydrogenase (NAD+)
MTAAPHTEFDTLIAAQQAYVESGATRPYTFRIEQLRKLKQAVKAHEERLLSALAQDLRKPAIEGFAAEIGFVYADINHTIKHLKRWMKPRRVGTPLQMIPSTSRVYAEPLGRVLVIAPWNYPVMLLLAPLAAAIAAGNVAVLKPSELAPATSAAIAELIGETFPRELATVVEGGVDASQALLARKWDHIFFTGGTAVGKIVAKAAAEHLTPVTLELGGKSPCIVTADADLDLAARRIAWGKFYNAGQTCVAPDYILADRSVKAALVERLTHYIRQFYGADPAQSPDLARIINDRHFDRLAAMLAAPGARLAAGGQTDRTQRYIAPTVLDDVGRDHPAMQEEIFGPILPVLAYDTLEQAFATIKTMSHPLALYLFTRSRDTERRVLGEVSFGGGCVNDVLMHLSNLDLPFGGVGPSGTGAYHGKWGFDTFSHFKGVVHSGAWFDPPVRYLPSGNKLKLFKWIFR